MGFFSGKTKKITTGGEFIRGIKGEGESLRPLVGTAIEAAKQPFQAYDVGQRFSGFTPEELQAMEQQRGIAGLAPTGMQERLDELAGLRQQAMAGIGAEDIAAKRQLLDPMTAAQTQAAQRGLQQALKSIGVGAGGAGVGALTGARADILRGGAAGEFAQTLADIEGQAQERALGMTEADLSRRLGTGAALIGQELGVEQDIYGRRLGATQLLSDVGTRQRELEQQRRDFTYGEAMREEEAPFLAAQRATSAVGGLAGLMTPQQTQVIKKKSGFQKALGAGMMVAGAMTGNPGMMASGANQAAKTGGGISRLAMGGTPLGLRPSNVAGKGSSNFLKKLFDKTKLSNNMTRDEMDEIADIEDFSDEKFGTKYGEERAQAKEADSQRAAALISAGSSLMDDEIIDMGSAQLTPAQQRARSRYFQAGGGIASLQVGGTPSLKSAMTNAMSQIQALNAQMQGLSLSKKDQEKRKQIQAKINDQQKIFDDASNQLSQAQAASSTADAGAGAGQQPQGGVLSRIIDGAKQMGGEFFSGAAQKFGDIPASDKFMYGLSLLATDPAGPEEGTETTIARALLGGRQMIENLKPEVTVPEFKASGYSLSDFEKIAKEEFKSQMIATGEEANKIAELRELTNTMVANAVLSGRLPDSSELVKNAQSQIFRSLLREEFPDKTGSTVTPAGSEDTGLKGVANPEVIQNLPN
jgi:hypothetical protein